MTIIEEVWSRLRSEYPNKDKLQEIDKLSLSLEKIIVQPYKLEDSGIVDYVEYLNSQIERSKYSGTFVISADCTSEHYRLKDFRNEKVQTLDSALSYIEFQRLAKIELTSNKIVLKPLPFLGSKPCNA